MIKKTIAVYLAILAAILFFDVHVPELSDLLPQQKMHESVQPTDRAEPTPGVAAVRLDDRFVCLGDDLQTVLSRFGEAVDVLPSEYGFSWYIFHENYQNYIQIGMAEDRVVGIYTNAPHFEVLGITPGMTRDDVRLLAGDLVFYIEKADGRYQTMSEDTPVNEGDLFFAENAYIHVFYDMFKNDSVTSVNIIARETEIGFSRLYGEASPQLAESFARQSYYVANALRVREGVKAFVWSDALCVPAKGHAVDMAKNNYFSHDGIDGRRVKERIEDAGISFRRCGENLAMGAQNALIMHELLMNSEGHRKNLLTDFQYMGVGVSFREDNAPFLVQNFMTPPVTAIIG